MRPCSNSDPSPQATVQCKIIISGGLGAGKTTFVSTISDIPPLITEERFTTASEGTDDLAGLERKVTTTVAMDFGLLAWPEHNMELYLFGTPGQHRFWFMWDELIRGAAGAVVLADTRRLEDCFGPVEFFLRRGLPFILAVNVFDDAYRYEPGELRDALRLDPGVPILFCDARERHSVTGVLGGVVAHVLKLLT
ncbi:GTP-binding protein [Saccharopolyspora sp. NPDC003752]|uniref:Signal recognition particle receptor subunit beta, a GTPase n=1 Tax=Saccharopolyspora shandongensis TaxID=418495 RepID=A0A1H3G6Y9_9PSEU|nr:ATP/GTP-binding protein [Saccharopolyspora shandongensis]SDX98810.1 hypothetical protein SAMN05216215_101864 [Saccharopolyspora shandongensis]